EPLRVGIASPTLEEQASLSELRTVSDVLAEAVAVPYDDRAADEFYLRTTSEPSVDVNGIVGGKPGVLNTTVPAPASANFTIPLGVQVARELYTRLAAL